MASRIGKLNRSDFHRLLNPVKPENYLPEATSDLLGGVFLLGMWSGVVLLVRLVLAI